MNQGACGILRILFRVAGVVVIVALGLFIFLRTYGLPDPLLREAVRRANTAGVPIDVDRVTLTLRGWRASNFRYYSKHPDDLKPVVFAERLYLTHLRPFAAEWSLDAEAAVVEINPPVEWGIDVPSDSGLRVIKNLKVSVEIYSDRVSISQCSAQWMGAGFNVDGLIIKPLKPSPRIADAARKDRAVPAKIIDARRFEDWEQRLRAFLLDEGLDVHINFIIDTRKLADSKVTYRVTAGEIASGNTGLSSFEIVGGYAFPRIDADLSMLFYEEEHLKASAAYNVESGQAEGTIDNTIASRQLLNLLPRSVADFLVKERLTFGSTPGFSIAFGPALIGDILEAVEGTFEVDELNYRGMEVKALKGHISRTDSLLQFEGLHASVAGKEHLAASMGSCMIGGHVEGMALWDMSNQLFRVEASGSLDPSLLLEPLDRVGIATNVIHRFRFPERPPKISLQLGSSLTDWKTFFINIDTVANNVSIHGTPFASANVSAKYANKVLQLDPLAVTQEPGFLRGATHIDFRTRTAGFDVRGSLKPYAIEDLIYPRLDLFGNRIKAGDETKITAIGTLDWATMRNTEFIAEVTTDHLEIPLVRMDDFSATVLGKGPFISVENAKFRSYGGAGSGDFSIRLDPLTKAMPYELDIDIKQADFLAFLKYITKNAKMSASGMLSASAHCTADMAGNFFETAKGSGNVLIKDGQLADLPLFGGFSRLIRNVFPAFSVFPITRLQGTFELRDGAIHSDDAYFEGDLLSAKGWGKYSNKNGFDANLQVQALNDSALSKVVRVITDPFFKLLEMKLEGPLGNPTWRLEKLQRSEKKPDAGKGSEESN